MNLKTLQFSSKRDQVANRLREAILGGEFSPGDRLVESRIANELGVSQAPVREALALLERQGLVIKINNRGTFVSRLHARELRELFAVRAVLDAFSARLAAENASDADVRQLKSLLARMRAAEEAGDLPRLTEVHLQLHEEIYRLSGNQLLAEIFAFIHPRMALALAFAENLFKAEGHETDCHEPLIDALAAGDPEQAERMARELALGWIDQVVVDKETS